jgi:hypothetical protein
MAKHRNSARSRIMSDVEALERMIAEGRLALIDDVDRERRRRQIGKPGTAAAKGGPIRPLQG